MITETYEEELHQARLDLTSATAEVMALVRDGKEFGEQWEAANERETAARQKFLDCSVAWFFVLRIFNNSYGPLLAVNQLS